MVGRHQELRLKLAPLRKTSTVSRSWEPPRESRNLFPIYRQFLHWKLSSGHIFRSLGQPRLSPCAGKISTVGEIWQTMPTPCHRFSPFTFDLLVTNGHSSEQVSVWDDGQPDDCVCETFVLSRGRVSNRDLVRLLLSFSSTTTFLFVDHTKTLHPHLSGLSASFGG